MPDLDPFKDWGKTLWRAFLFVLFVGFPALMIAAACLGATGRLEPGP